MSTAQNAVTAEPGNGPAAIRARVGDSAIDKVTRLFSANRPRRYFHRDAAKFTPGRRHTASPRPSSRMAISPVVKPADDGEGSPIFPPSCASETGCHR